MEGENYAFRAFDLCSAGIGAPHIRQRLFFVAHAAEPRRDGFAQRATGENGWSAPEPGRLCDAGGVAYAESLGLLGRQDDEHGGRRERASGQGREANSTADAGGERLEVLSEQSARGQCAPAERSGETCRSGPVNGLWRDADWLYCTDGRWRPVEPESFPLVDGSAFRLGSGSAFEGKSRAAMLKGYGNAINVELAAEFIRAYLEI
jgi:DNA (cytosine-5)-methyltransferase 1